jgi:hypothetical protein
LAAGSFALGTVEAGPLSVTWTASGQSAQADLTRGGVYRLTLDSAGLGTEVSLTPWD